MDRLVVFTAKHCEPCHRITDLIKQGKYEGEVELVDIETNEGFARFRAEVLERGDGAVPSAYREGTKCLILVEEDQLSFECPNPAGFPSEQPGE